MNGWEFNPPMWCVVVEVDGEQHTGWEQANDIEEAERRFDAWLDRETHAVPVEIYRSTPERP